MYPATEAISMENPESFAGLSNQDKVSGNHRGPSNSGSRRSLSGSAASRIITQNTVADQKIYCRPADFCGYYYPGYDVAYRGWNEEGYFLRRDGMEMAYSGPGFLSAATQKCYDSYASLFSNQGCGALHPQKGLACLRTDGRRWAGNDRFMGRQKFIRSGTFGSSNDTSRGPRAGRVNNTLSSSSEKDRLSPSVQRDKYNLQDFRITYGQAMFFVIKSYSEDDIHKSIKYNVWASTSHGNEKLNAAFHDAELRSDEKGIRCPIFLFFSVNASGQFVGLAEMTGPVDFKKTMDFWQLDKWDGFFPVRWCIIKDIPNSQLRHILLANNDNKPVTNSRDTQEINHQQGLEMLYIFKSYQEKTSMLDDFGFYDIREKLKCQKHLSLHTETETSNQPAKIEARAGYREWARAKTAVDPTKSLINLTRDLSLKP